MTRKEPAVYEFVDRCVNEKKIKIKELPIEILKNKDGIKLGLIRIDNLKLYKRDEDTNGNLIVTATLSIQYINKRKMEMEPFLEPWAFCFSKVT